MLLTERAMLSRVTIRQWSARKLDRKVTHETNMAHNAAADAGRYNKRLISKDALAKIAKAAGAIRAQHYAMTLPWQDEGARILSASAYLGYTQELAKQRIEFETASAEFVAGYDEFVMDARARLNGMFNPADYPDSNDIAALFSVDVSISPVPDAQDFRVALGDAQAAAIREDIEARSRAALESAMRDVWGRIAEHVGRMAERLKNFRPSTGKGDKAENVFRDSLVDNVRELARLLPALNITGDAALARIADRISADLTRDDAEELRQNASARASVAAAADAIMADVSEFLA